MSNMNFLDCWIDPIDSESSLLKNSKMKLSG